MLPNSDFHLFWGKLPDDELSNQTVNSLELNGCLGADPDLLDKPSRPSRFLFFVLNRRYFLFSGRIGYCDFCMPSVVLSVVSWTSFI